MFSILKPLHSSQYLCFHLDIAFGAIEVKNLKVTPFEWPASMHTESSLKNMVKQCKELAS